MTRIISADCHINEPPWVFDPVPAEYKDRAPKLVRAADGGDGWSFDGKPPKRSFGIEAMAGRLAGAKTSGLRFDDHPDRTLSVGRSIYLRLPDESHLWAAVEQFVEIDRTRLIEAFNVRAPRSGAASRKSPYRPACAGDLDRN